MISAANAHISKTQSNQYNYMGKLLHQKHQNDYYSIGFFHSLGNPVHLNRTYFFQNKAANLPQHSLQYQLLQLEKLSLFIDLKYLKRSRKLRWIDKTVLNVIQTYKHQEPINLSVSYDGIIWIKTVTHPIYID